MTSRCCSTFRPLTVLVAASLGAAGLSNCSPRNAEPASGAVPKPAESSPTAASRDTATQPSTSPAPVDSSAGAAAVPAATPAPAAADVAVERGEALLAVAVDVVGQRVAGLLHGREQRVEQRPARRAPLEPQRPA